MRRLLFIVLILIGLTGCGVQSEEIVPSNTTVANGPQDELGMVTEPAADQTKEPAEEYAVYTPSEELSSDIRSFQIQLGEHIFQFPLMYAQFVDSGWQINEKYEDINGCVNSGEDQLIWFINDGKQINCYLFNPDISAQTYENCVVAGMQVDVQSDAKGMTAFIPGGFQLGVAMLDEVVDAIGEADDIYTSSSRTVLTYKTENIWASIELVFDSEGILSGYKAENPLAPAEYAMSSPQGADIAYIKPTALGASIEDRVVLFGGDLYQLPAPLSAFLENGWETEDAEATVQGGGLLSFNLHRGEDSFRVSVWNYSQIACKVEDAYLEKLSSNDAGEEFMISSRVGMAITETELVDILNAEGYEFEREEIAGGVRYAIKLDGAEANNYCTIKFADGVVQYITISAGEDSLRE